MGRRHKHAPELIDKVRDLIRQGLSDAAIAKQMDMRPSQISGIKYRSWNTADRADCDKTESLFHVAYEIDPLLLRGDFMVVGDVHVPTTDYRLARLVAQVGQKHLEHPRLIIAGDFFNFDAFSSYTAVVQSYSWREERKAATALFHEWLKTFEEIFVIMGNHDRRVQKWSQGALEESDIFGMVIANPKVRVSNIGWLLVDTPGGDYRVTHAKNYSINQLTVADQLSQKFRQNIIQFHEHHLGLGYDRYGYNIIINGGGLFDPMQMVYARLDDSKSGAMIPGFVMLREGTPYLFGNAPFTDWKRWL